jgi:hypothetical protein
VNADCGDAVFLLASVQPWSYPHPCLLSHIEPADRVDGLSSGTRTNQRLLWPGFATPPANRGALSSAASARLAMSMMTFLGGPSRHGVNDAGLSTPAVPRA